MHSEWKGRVVERFDEQAISYGRHNDVQTRIAHKLASALPDLSRPNILEIGCGTGALTKHLLGRYPAAHFHITDISPKMLEEAQRQVPSSNNIKWTVIDGEAFPADKTYDLIVSSMTFQWFEEPNQSIGALKRLLSPAGKLFFSVPSPQSFPEWQSTLSALNLPLGFSSQAHWDGIFQEDRLTLKYGNTIHFLKTMKETCLLYTSPSPRDQRGSRMPSSA